MNSTTGLSMHSLSSSSDKNHYMPGLDGLRALSVLAVIAYHLKLPYAPGGLLGVGVFFTLSGYLITDQLLMEWQRTKRIDIKKFWIRRIRRLLPALFFMIIMVALWLYCFDRPRLVSLKGEILSAVFYFNNWWLIFHKVSYFEKFGPLSPFGHLWSLSIEEQFYILWPLLLPVILRFFHKRQTRIIIFLLGAAISILAMVFIYQPGGDPSRVYYGTDTRAFALLVGAALALIWPSKTLSAPASEKVQSLLEVTGGVGLLVIIFMMTNINEYEPALYTYGLAGFSVLSAVVIAAAAHPANFISKILGCKPLRWVGLRSYGLYLWHYPVIILTSPIVDTGDFNIGRVILQFMLCLLLASISWSLIEVPVRNGSLNPSRDKAPSRAISKPGYAIIMIMTLIILLTSCSVNLFKNFQSNPSAFAEGIINMNSLIKGTDLLNKNTKEGFKQGSDSGNSMVKPAAADMISGGDVTAIGDSIMVDVKSDLEKQLPGIIVDGKIGRQMYEAQDVVNQLKMEGKLREIVIIELGNNGSFTEKQLRSLLSSLGDVKQIYLVNTRVPRMWQDSVNNDLDQAASKYKKVELVDWFNASKSKDSYFYPDGVHLTPEGSENYTEMLIQAIQHGKESKS